MHTQQHTHTHTYAICSYAYRYARTRTRVNKCEWRDARVVIVYVKDAPIHRIHRFVSKCKSIGSSFAAAKLYHRRPAQQTRREGIADTVSTGPARRPHGDFSSLNVRHREEISEGFEHVVATELDGGLKALHRFIGLASE